jgi:hypothetical protein
VAATAENENETRHARTAAETIPLFIGVLPLLMSVLKSALAAEHRRARNAHQRAETLIYRKRGRHDQYRDFYVKGKISPVT